MSVQHTQKCLETSQLSQELQGERKLLMQYQQENEELKQKQVETFKHFSYHQCFSGNDVEYLDSFNVATWQWHNQCLPPVIL